MKPPRNTLEGLLSNNPDLARRAADRAGLAEVASMLLQLRSELKLSQKDLAARAGLSKTMISELENAANSGLTLRTLVRVARGAGASLDLTLRLHAACAGSVVTSLHTGRYDFANEIGAMRFAKGSSARRTELAA